MLEHFRRDREFSVYGPAFPTNAFHDPVQARTILQRVTVAQVNVEIADGSQFLFDGAIFVPMACILIHYVIGDQLSIILWLFSSE